MSKLYRIFAADNGGGVIAPTENFRKQNEKEFDKQQSEREREDSLTDKQSGDLSQTDKSLKASRRVSLRTTAAFAFALKQQLPVKAAWRFSLPNAFDASISPAVTHVHLPDEWSE